MKRTIKTAVLSILSAVCIAGVLTATASATLPGKNGPLLADEFPSAGEGKSLVTLDASGGSRETLYSGDSMFNGGLFFTPNGLPVAWNSTSNFSVNPKTLAVKPFPGVFVDFGALVEGISPDGKTLIRTVNKLDRECLTCEITVAPESGIWVADRDGSNVRKLASDPSQMPTAAQFTPDGKRLVIIARKAGDFESPDSSIFVANTDGTNWQEVASFPAIQEISVSPDSSKVAFTINESTFEPPKPAIYSTDIRVASLDGSGSRALTDDGTSSRPVFSPDGKKIAYERSDPFEEAGIWTMNVNGKGNRKVSGGGYLYRLVDWGRAETFRIKKYDRRRSQMVVRIWNPGKVMVKGPQIAAAARHSGPGRITLPVSPRPNVKLKKGAKVPVTVTFKPDGALKSVKKRVIKLG